jgi:hypothetical protein
VLSCIGGQESAGLYTGERIQAQKGNMADEHELNTVVVEFNCPSEQADGPNNPVGQLIEVFNRTKLRFAVEEYRISREEILADPYWKDWRDSHEGDIPAELALFVFLCSEENRPTFCRLFEGWMQEKERQAKEQGG